MRSRKRVHRAPGPGRVASEELEKLAVQTVHADDVRGEVVEAFRI
jgi:hypothetical protein